MTFSIPQPIPSRSSHPVHAHQRPPIRRSLSHNASADILPGLAANSKFGLSRLLASSEHHLNQPDYADDLSLTNDDDDDAGDEDDDDEEEDNDSETRIDSGHYSDRGIPIGKAGFLFNQKSTSHLYGIAGGSVDSRGRLSQDYQPASRFKYSHSHSNSDSHNSFNLPSDNLNTSHASQKTGSSIAGFADKIDASLSHFQCQQLPQRQQLDGVHESQDSSPAPLNADVSSSSFTSLTSPSIPPASIARPQRALQKTGAYVGQQAASQDAFERSNDTSAGIHTNNINTNANANVVTESVPQNAHAHRNISIDTSKARLNKPEARTKATDSTAPTRETTKFKRAASVSIPPSYPNPTTSSSSTSGGSISGSSTRPLMMASQSRLSSALPPTPSFHQQSFSAQETQSTVLLPSLSPSSPSLNSALVTSLEQLSVSWKAPEHTPSFPINRLHRSRTISSGARPNFNSSFSSSGTLGSNSSLNPYQNSIMSPSTMVTSSSYSSLPFSPAVAFLSNFVDVTAPKMAPDEEGEQVGDFIMGKIIGHGGFSLVREAFAIHLDGLVAQVAVKIVKTQTGLTDNDRVQRMLDKEIAIWSRLAHPNVLPFIAVEKLPTDTFVFCELCTGGHLLDFLTRQEAPSYSTARPGSTVGLEENQARLIFNQIAEAVRYLHEEKRIVHRDIKLENILQHEDGTWKICDFGLAEYQNDEAASYFGSPLSPTIYNPRAASNNANNGGNGAQEGASSNNDRSFDASMEDVEEDDMVGGSLAYCSPEQLRSTKPLRCPSSDVWSLGVVLYALLTGRLPFQDEYEPRLQHQILNGRYEDPTECSAEARDLLKNMFRSKPDDRWRIGQVIDSPWCMGTTLEESTSSSSMMMGFGGFSMSTNSNSNSNSTSHGFSHTGVGGGDHAKMNNIFASLRF
ncbi:hypothetical protein BGZ98_001733 [Dissophora globulifera]|nr:hypothetical protein BGZ98_001733 [Dissophora globulifera]